MTIRDLDNMVLMYTDEHGQEHPINVQEAHLDISVDCRAPSEHDPFDWSDKEMTIQLETHKVPVWLARSQRYFKRVWMDYSIALSVERANEKLEKVGVKFA
jgi:hypothetical protein